MKLHAGNIILVGFGGMVLFMSWLVFRCTQNPSMMVSQNYYEQELVYQDLIDAKMNAQSSNDKILFEKTDHDVVLSLQGDMKLAMTSANLQVYNKADDSKDKLVKLEKNDLGVYSVSTKDWSRGNYILKLMVYTKDKNYYQEFNFSS
ncbi:MAG: FixH family protein [Chitinophagaceae bacterium]|jgi:hypothetical protein|nr:FixH family protein [Chitinophagaceae bacterium]